jgi:hypothetical protein
MTSSQDLQDDLQKERIAAYQRAQADAPRPVHSAAPALGVWQGFKFGFGFAIGLFLFNAILILIAMFFFSAFFSSVLKGATLLSTFSGH